MNASTGVVLYQLRRGSLPFGDENTLLPRLIENVRTVDPVHNPLPLSATAATGESKMGDKNGMLLYVFMSRWMMLFLHAGDYTRPAPLLLATLATLIFCV